MVRPTTPATTGPGAEAGRPGQRWTGQREPSRRAQLYAGHTPLKTLHELLGTLHGAFRISCGRNLFYWWHKENYYDVLIGADGLNTGTVSKL